MSIIKIMSLLLTLILVNSCEKDKSELLEESACLDSSFIIGYDNNCMDIIPFVSVMYPIGPEPRYGENHIGLDIDIDGVVDFRIEVYFSFGIAHHINKSSIEVVNNSFNVSVIEVPDTVRRCIGMDYNTYSDYSCYHNRIDTIINISMISYPKPYSIGDTITQRESWLNGYLTLALNEDGVLSAPNYSYIRGTWLGDQDHKYILFRKESNGVYLYGWLELSISSFTNIRIHESAIQKSSIE